MELYIYASLGMLLYILFDLSALQRATPHLTLTQTVAEYFKKNALYVAINVVALGVIMSLASKGETGFLTSLGIQIQSGLGGAFIFGFTSQTLLTALRKIINPIEVVTRGDKVVTTE